MCLSDVSGVHRVGVRTATVTGSPKPSLQLSVELIASPSPHKVSNTHPTKRQAKSVARSHRDMGHTANLSVVPKVTTLAAQSDKRRTHLTSPTSITEAHQQSQSPSAQQISQALKAQ